MESPISLEQLIILMIVNLIGLSCFGLIFRIMQRKHENKKHKIKASIELGLTSLVFLIVIFADIGIYFWVKSGDFRAALLMLPFLLCMAPIFFPVVSFGSYIQLGYRDKIESIAKSISGENRVEANHEKS